MLARMRTLILSISLVFALFLPGWATDSGTAPTLGMREYTPEVVVFTGATIVVSPERTIENGTLIVDHGRVRAVGAGLPAPPGAWVHDLAGRTVYPGFVDPYTEYGLSRVGPLNPKRESRKPQYEGTRIGANGWNDAIHAQRNWVDEFVPDAEEAGRLLRHGITVVQSGKMDGVFRGRAFVATLAEGTANRRVLVAHARQFASFHKGSSAQRYPSSLMGSIALVRQTLIDADWYASARAAVEANPDQQLPTPDHAIAALADDAGPIVFETADWLSLLRAARISAEFGREMIHVGSGSEYRGLDAIAETGQPLILPVVWPDRPEVESYEDALDVDLSELRLWERAPHNPGALERAGVRFAFTSHGLGPEDDFLAEVRNAVARGLSPATALAALTVIPAELCGAADRIGTLEPGMLANFVVAEGPLFEDDVELLSVWIEGRVAEERVPLGQVDFRGSYSLRLEETDLELMLTGKLGAAKGTLSAGDEKVDLEGLRLGRDRLTFRAKLDELGLSGIARFSIVRSDDELQATITLADGRRLLASFAPGGAGAGGDADKAPPRRDASDAHLASRLTYPDMAYGFQSLPEPQDLLVRGATIWTGEEPGLLEGADLRIVDGKIDGIGVGLSAPPGGRIIDAAGKHITAGIVDEHSHIAIARGVNEGSHAVTPEVRVGDVIRSDDIGIYRALAGGVTTIQALHGSANPIGGQAQVLKLRWGRPPEELKLDDVDPTIKFALGENVKQSNRGRDYTSRYPQSRMGVESLMMDSFLAAREYGEEWNAFRQLNADEQARTVPPRRDLRLEALVEILDRQRFVHCHSYAQSEILMLMRLAEELDFRIQTFTHILEGYKVAPEMAAHGASASTFTDWWAYKFEVYDAIPYNTCLMNDNGIVVSVNSDSAELMRRLNQEAGKMVMYCGMDEQEALKLATLNPAIQLRVDDRIGSLKEGKDADFVIWSGPPLSMFSRPEQTWVDGVNYFHLERDAEMRAADRAEREALIQKALGTRDDGKKRSRKTRGPERDAWHCDDVEDVWDE